MSRFYLIFSLSIACVSIFNQEIVPVEKDPSHLYAIIMAGGSGERLWPLSRQHCPKQLLSVGNQGTLLDQTIDRLLLSIPPENIFISTTKRFEKIINTYVGHRVGNILIEPSSRNTAPAILLTCMNLYEQDPEAVILFAPSDPFIPKEDNHRFAASVNQALEFSQSHDCITLLGIKPTFPATEYGYIEYVFDTNQPPYKAIKFHEKPSLEVAHDYLAMNNMLWNIGMFCGKASVFIDEFRREAPEIYGGVLAYTQGQRNYDNVRADSIDYAVMERSKNIYVLPVDLTWRDVGNVAVFLSIKNQYSKVYGQRICIKSKNNLIDAPDDMLVAILGVDDLCVVKKENILLITKQKYADQIRTIVNQLKEEEQKTYL